MPSLFALLFKELLLLDRRTPYASIKMNEVVGVCLNSKFFFNEVMYEHAEDVFVCNKYRKW